MKKFLFVLCSTTVLFGACDKKEILPGKRESVEGINESAKFDKEILNSTIRISVTPSTVVSEYKDVAGNKQHKALNYKVAQNPKMLWKTSIGGAQISSEPIAFNGHAYVVNSHGDLVCIELKDGKQKWSLNIAKQPDDASFAGGITAENSVIYASTNIGDVVAVNTTTQKILWKKSLKYPLRGAPLYADGIVIVNSIDGQTFALNALNGNVIWMKKLQGEMTVMSKASTPALFGHSIICAYSSGDLKSYDLRSGGDNWDDVLFSANLSDSGTVFCERVCNFFADTDNVVVVVSISRVKAFVIIADIFLHK
ncbi:MAG: PQQ-like beta-propeller repeat protein [Alphaproteobacteria bacterium]|nr:PQQ-like beta-propeller repeat protein [Alphaproteobacteria bacterium]